MRYVLFCAIGAVLLTFLLACFVLWQINPSMWSQSNREATAYCMALAAFFGAVLGENWRLAVKHNW